MFPSLIYQDENLLVINKPAGLLTHPKSAKDPSQSVVSWLLEKYPEIKKVGDHMENPGTSEEGRNIRQNNIGTGTLRPGIVHRLDKETSGLMLVAKNQKSFEYFKNLFQERLIKKTYLALVYGNLKNKTGTIELPLGKLGTKQTTRIKGKKDLKEREAVTEYKVIKEFLNYSLLEVYPKTGRTHQIRVHLNAIGHPIVCDKIYGGRKKYCPPELGRLFLHAQKLEFTTPSGQKLLLETDPPEELTSFLNSSIIRQ